MIRQAIILAAGKGTRMLDLTKDQAKPMIKIAGRSLIHRLMDQLVDYGIEKVVINTFHEAQKMEDHINQYDKKVNIQIIREKELLETGGGIINMLPCLKKEPFFVVNGDALLVGDNVFHYLNNTWSYEMNALLLLFKKANAFGYRGSGDFNLDSSGRIVRDNTRNNRDYVFSGAHVSTHQNFKGFPVQSIKLTDIYNFDKEDHNMYGGVFERGTYLHVGDKDAVQEAENFFLKK